MGALLLRVGLFGLRWLWLLFGIVGWLWFRWILLDVVVCVVGGLLFGFGFLLDEFCFGGYL